ncbi:MAG: ABC transporter permease [Spirochaetales bacterium]|nr:ABC transporter permease [Spirochaetales bacterium]
MRRFLAIFNARNLEFFRDRGNFFWNMFLPIFLIFGFAFAFSGNNDAQYKIGLSGQTPDTLEFLGFKYLQFIPYKAGDAALDKLRHHQLDMYIDFDAGNYYVNTDSPKGYIVERLLLSDRGQSLHRQSVSGQSIRYVDWFVPGVIGMNIMFGCIIGVGFVIIRYRKNGVLKRFKATPIHPAEFISAQMFSRFFIMALMCTVLFAGTNFFLHFMMNGSYLDLAFIAALAILCHISLGLLFSTRIKSQELAGGVMNMFIWPMMFLSGIFFSLEGTPPVLQTISRFFPITHFIEAARKIMLDGATLAGVMDNILIMAGMTLLFLITATLIFKWE